MDPREGFRRYLTPVEKILQMFDIITNPTDGKSSLLTAYLGACMMTSNALQSGRAITILQLLLNPPIDDKGGIYFNTFWEFMLDPKITAYDRVPAEARLGYDKHPMYTQVYGNANIPNDVWDAMLTGEPWPVKVMISVANDPLGCFEDTEKIHRALLNDILELNVDMDYFMTPATRLPTSSFPPPTGRSALACLTRSSIPSPVRSSSRRRPSTLPGEAQDDWYFQRELGRRFAPDLWPWKSSEEMQLWRLNEFHLKPNGKEPINDYEEAAKIGYFVLYGGENRTTRQHEKGLVKFQTPTSRIEVFSEQMPSYGYDSPLPSYSEPFRESVSDAGPL